VKLRHAIAAHAPVRWADVEIDETAEAVRIRRDMERLFATPTDAAGTNALGSGSVR